MLNRYLKRFFLIPIIFLVAIVSTVGFSETLKRSEIKVGDYVSLGRYENEPIVWQVVGIEPDGNPILFSRRILTIKAFDASGPKDEEDVDDNFETDYGSNNWETSTLRQWLNSVDQRIKWTNNAPDASNIFKGEKPYDSEPGFLHSSNFSAKEKAIIKVTQYKMRSGRQLNDKVFLLSIDEVMAYSVCSDCFPLQDLKHQGISKPYDIWTRDSVREVPHAVNTLKWDGSQSKKLANVSRTGVAPALVLDLEKIEKLTMAGNGLSYKPYYFEFKTERHYLVILGLTIAGILCAGATYILLGSARYQTAFMMIGILCVSVLLTAAY